MNNDDPSESRLAELLRLAEDLRKSFAGKPEMERAAAYAVLVAERMIADEDETAAVYLRILRTMTDIARTEAEPGPGETMH